jgi:hypothetical protein
LGNERTEEAKAKESEVLDVNIPRTLWLKCFTVKLRKDPGAFLHLELTTMEDLENMF